MKVLLLYQQCDWSFSHWRKLKRSILIENSDVMDCEGTSQAPSFHSLLLSVSLFHPPPLSLCSHLSVFFPLSFLSWQATGLLLWDHWIKTQQLPRLVTKGNYSTSKDVSWCLYTPHCISIVVFIPSIHKYVGHSSFLSSLSCLSLRYDTQVDSWMVCQILSRQTVLLSH